MGDSLKTIDAFQASTHTIAGGQDLQIMPIQQVYLNNPPGYLYTEWMLEGDEPSLPDGNIDSQQIQNVASSRILFSNFQFTTAVSNNFTLNLLPNDRRVLVIFDAPMAAGNVTVIATGITSGIQWTAFIADNLVKSTSFGGQLWIPVSGSVDSQVTLAIQATTQGAILKMTVIAFQDDFAVGNIQNPVLVADPYGPYTAVTSGTVSTTTAIVPAPSVGFATQVAHILLAPGTAGAAWSAAGAARISLHSSGVWLCALEGATGDHVSGQVGMPCNLITTEQIDITFGGSPPACHGDILYRTIPATGL